MSYIVIPKTSCFGRTHIRMGHQVMAELVAMSLNTGQVKPEELYWSQDTQCNCEVCERCWCVIEGELC